MPRRRLEPGQQTRPVDHGLLAVTGYTDKLSYHAGERVVVHASSTDPSGSMRLVRLDHDGKTFTAEAAGPSTAIELIHQDVTLGSYGIVESLTLPAAAVVLHACVWLSLLPRAERRDATVVAVDGLALQIDTAGRAFLRAGDETVRCTTALERRRWYRVSGGLDPAGRPFVAVESVKPRFGEHTVERVAGEHAVPWSERRTSLVFAQGLDGKVEDVAISRGSDETGSEDVLRLDFARGISTWLVHDGDGQQVGRVVGLPTRAVMGAKWDGSQLDWRHAPDHYAAIHFHTDDQVDQHWPATETIDLPEDLAGGLYAVELTAGGDTDYLPIVVRPQRAAAPLLVLLPSLTYLAYALEHVVGDLAGFDMEKCPELSASFARANGLHSWYDRHADGSPVVLLSLHRPLISVRPDHRYRLVACEHGLSADLHLLGWLGRQGIAFDVATDHDLDAEGVDLLSPYRAVVSGGHPEYVTGLMLNAIEAYLDEGGSFAYLGGNGFFWTVATDPTDPSVAELRRGAFISWPTDGDVREAHFQLTGDPGGVWEMCGRPPAAMFGIGFRGTSLEPGAAFRRTEASFDPRVAHLFEGIGTDEPIGEHGAILGAGASLEVDGANPMLGTPAHALIVASAVMPEAYVAVRLPGHSPDLGEDDESNRRADVVWFETPAGGAVFSAGSIGWNGALSHDNDDNALSRLTANALRSLVRRPVRGDET